MTISLSNSSPAGKSNILPNEPGEADHKAEDFAALLSVPVFAPPANTPVRAQKSDDSETALQDSGSSANGQLAVGQQAQRPDMMTTKDPGLPVPDALGGRREPADEVNNNEGPLPPEFESQRSRERMPFDQIVPGTEPKSVKTQSRLPVEYTPVSFIQPPANAAGAIQFTPEVHGDRVFNDLPNTFKNVSNILEADDASKVNSAIELLGPPTAEGSKQFSFSQDQSNLNDRETQLLPDQIEMNAQDRPSDSPFAGFLNSLSPGAEIADHAAHIQDLQAKVLQQMEPRIVELAAFSQPGQEKRIFRMRLNPAELGGVEITLVKNAAGKISAHIQTESESTRHLLNESLAQLRNSLENSGLQVGDLQISCRSFSPNGHSGGEGRPNNFGTAEAQPVEIATFGGDSNNPDEEQVRLVSLRA